MLLVLHISDIHIKKADQLKPIDSVIAAIRGLNIFPEGVVVVITGDITWSGQEEQFFEADSYFTRLLNSISQELNCPVHFVACPGNHDCAFPEDNGLRDLAVESIRVQGQLPSSQLVISQCVDVQKNFFSWLNTVPSLESVEEGALAWLVPSVVCGGVRLHFRVLNTSWASTVREEQGKLFFPPSIIPEIPTSDLRISLFHHPYNWFRSENGRDLRRILEESSDLILTGHEHDSTYYHKTDNHAQSVAYIEGGVFNDGRGLKSSFNIVEIDLKKSQYRCFALEWRHDRYSAEGQAPLWQKFICTTSSISRENRLSQDMNKFLKDPGAHLMHSATNIELEDIFVAPDLQKYEGISNEKPPSRALIVGRRT